MLQKSISTGSGMIASVLLALALCLLTGCLDLLQYFNFEEAPIEDGLYVTYYIDDGSWITVKFSKIAYNQYSAEMRTEYENEDEDSSDDQSKPNNRVIVDKTLKKENGSPLEAGFLGPIWTPPSSIKKGGTIHGTYIDDIKQWNKWEIAVVKASFGRGAISGEWYYDKKTGFLVGGNSGTVMDEKNTNFILNETNLKRLMP